MPAAWRPRGRPRPSAAPTCLCRPCPPPAGRSLPAPPRAPRLPARPGPPDASLAPPQPCGPGGGASEPGPPPSPVRPPIGPPLLSVSWERLRPHWVAPKGEAERALGLWSGLWSLPSLSARLALRAAPVPGSDGQGLGAASALAGPGDQLPSSPASMHTLTPRNLTAGDGRTLRFALLALLKTAHVSVRRS